MIVGLQLGDIPGWLLIVMGIVATLAIIWLVMRSRYDDFQN